MATVRPALEISRTLPHKEYDQAQLVLTAGKRGKGKTTFLRDYIRRLEPRVIALDPFADFDTLTTCETIDDAIETMFDGKPHRLRLVPPVGESSREYADEFFRKCVDHVGDCLLVLDEITLWSPPAARKPLETLCLQGRRFGIRMLVACQRISLVPGVLLSECTEMVLFRLTRPRDLRVVEEWSDQQTAALVRSLDVGEAVLVKM